MFVDESGGDRGESPCEVLAGVVVQDCVLWRLIEAIKSAEEEILGVRYRMPEFPAEERRRLATECLGAGPVANREQITALAQAKLAFVHEAFRIVRAHNGAALASIVVPNAPRTNRDVLRKDYAFLFERFFYFLEDHGSAQGAVVFDELEKSQAHLLIGQMEEYFLGTHNGRERSRLVIPEPFFVHSDLTSLVQVADLIAYVVAWGFRVPSALRDLPCRPELASFSAEVVEMRYSTRRRLLRVGRAPIRGFAVIEDLRGWEDRGRA